jgi:glycosyltransferase involved in cell wall biosynthesis
MLISVIIPTYNHAPYLPQRLETVLNQSYQEFEVIILDDCSTDESREVLDRYRNHPKVSHVIYNERNSGSTFKQWDKGIALAQGEWIWLAESDDKAELNFLATMVAELKGKENIGIAYAQSRKLNSQDEVTGSWLEWTNDLDKDLFLSNFTMKGTAYIERFLIHKNTIPNASALLFKKACFYQAGGANDLIRNCGDWELWLKMLLTSDVLYVSQHLNYFRYHEQSVIARALKSRPKDVYAERFDKSMRLKFQFFLAERFNTKLYNSIWETNKHYIMLESIYETLFELIHRNFGSAFSKLRAILKQHHWLNVTKTSLEVVLKESASKV